MQIIMEGLVRYAEKIYFVPDVRLNALLPYRKWRFKKNDQYTQRRRYSGKEKINIFLNKIEISYIPKIF